MRMAIPTPTADKNNILKNPGAAATFLPGAVIGALVFIAFFGIQLINPTNTDWIFTNLGDVAQHHLGWVYYRHTPWTFPICMTDGISSDGMISCMYTDSIPLFAIIFKLLSPVLPENFQYIGLWGVICFALNGGFGASLLKRIEPNLCFTTIGSLFFSVFAPSLNRIHQHNSLGASWLVMLALMLTIDHKREYKHSFTPVAAWAATCVAATLIHLYFIPMIYSAMFAYVIMLFFRDKKRLRAVCTAVVPTLFSVLSLWIIGAFKGSGSYSDGGFGQFSANLNTFYNGLGTSRFIPSLPVRDGQYEGLGYLGVGMLLCCLLGLISAVIYFAKQEGSFFRNVLSYAKKHGIEIFAYVSAFCISFFWAVSTTVAFNEKVLLDIHLPFAIMSRLAVFRSSGRFIWLPCIMIMTFAVWLISKLKFKVSAALLTVCVLVNCIDFSVWRGSLHAQYTRPALDPNITESEWQEAVRGVDEVVFLPLPPDYRANIQLYFDISRLAARDRISLSSFYLARSDYGSLWEYADEQYRQLSCGNGREDALYVFFKDEDVPKDVDNMTVFRLGNYTVARVKK